MDSAHPFVDSFTEPILPAQYFDALKSRALCSEQRLMLAVLVDALNILLGWHRSASIRKRRAFTEAVLWINMREAAHPFSFENVCEALSIDAKGLRTRVHGLIEGRPGNASWNGVKHLRLTETIRKRRLTPQRTWRRAGVKAAMPLR